MQMQMLSPALAIQVLHQVLFKFLVKPFESIHIECLKVPKFLGLFGTSFRPTENVFENALAVHTSILLCQTLDNLWF
jgi:hypothetical protein